MRMQPKTRMRLLTGFKYYCIQSKIKTNHTISIISKVSTKSTHSNKKCIIMLPLLVIN